MSSVNTASSYAQSLYPNSYSSFNDPYLTSATQSTAATPAAASSLYYPASPAIQSASTTATAGTSATSAADLFGDTGAITNYDKAFGKLKKFDKNGDGKFSISELEAAINSGDKATASQAVEILALKLDKKPKDMKALKKSSNKDKVAMAKALLEEYKVALGGPSAAGASTDPNAAAAANSRLSLQEQQVVNKGVDMYRQQRLAQMMQDPQYAALLAGAGVTMPTGSSMVVPSGTSTAGITASATPAFSNANTFALPTGSTASAFPTTGNISLANATQLPSTLSNYAAYPATVNAAAQITSANSNPFITSANTTAAPTTGANGSTGFPTTVGSTQAAPASTQIAQQLVLKRFDTPIDFENFALKWGTTTDTISSAFAKLAFGWPQSPNGLNQQQSPANSGQIKLDYPQPAPQRATL